MKAEYKIYLSKTILTIVLGLIMAFAGVVIMRAQKAPAKVSPAMALAIRNAQVKFLQAQTARDASPQQQALNQAQAEFTQVVDKAFADAKVDPLKYNIDDTTWTFVPKPLEQPKK